MEETAFKTILKKLMTEQSLTQSKLAADIGIRQSQVHNWLIGKSLPGYNSLKLLKGYFKISLDSLVS